MACHKLTDVCVFDLRIQRAPGRVRTFDPGSQSGHQTIATLYQNHYSVEDFHGVASHLGAMDGGHLTQAWCSRGSQGALLGACHYPQL